MRHQTFGRHGKPVTMPWIVLLLLLLAPALHGPRTLLHARQDTGIAGTWEGNLDVGSISIRLVFHIDRSEDGGYTATMDSPDQGAVGLPVGKTSFADGTLSIDIPAIGAAFEGRLAEDGRSVVGIFSQHGASFPLVLRRVEEVSLPHRPQTPKPPFPYTETDVTFPNPEASITLAGTLAIPEGSGPFPAVVLVSGSGPQDRNSTVYGHAPFHVISDHLARNGIAVLRVDDRGVGASGGVFSEATPLDFASDAAAAIAFLETRAEIDPARTGIIGHSEGGIIAPLAAARFDGVDFLVLLAAPGLPGEQILYLQAAAIMRANGASEAAITANREIQETVFRIVREEDDADARRTRLRQALRHDLSDHLRRIGIPADDREAFIEGQVSGASSDWFRFFIEFDPRPTLQEVRVPILAIWGDKDLQIPSDVNLAAVRSALEAGGHTDFTLREVAGLNHLFQTARTGSPAEYGTIAETFSPPVLVIITDWILQTVGAAPRS